MKPVEQTPAWQPGQPTIMPDPVTTCRGCDQRISGKGVGKRKRCREPFIGSLGKPGVLSRFESRVGSRGRYAIYWRSLSIVSGNRSRMSPFGVKGISKPRGARNSE